MHFLVIAAYPAMLGLSFSWLKFFIRFLMSMGDLVMSRVRVMYWKEIPVQVQASDETQTMSSMLDDKFQQAADRKYDGFERYFVSAS